MMTWFILKVSIFVLLHWALRCQAITNPNIIIIGAGPSGIAAATKLLKNNFTNIKILEAEDRIGGRINSVKFGDAFVDMGAEFCAGEENNIVYSMVKDLNVVKHSNFGIKLVASDGEYLDDQLQKDILEVAESLDPSNLSPEFEKKCANMLSVAECLRKNINSSLLEKYKNDSKKLQIEKFISVYISSDYSPLDWEDLSIKSDTINCEGDLGLNWNGLGYKTILEVMMQKYPTKENQLPIDDKILLNKEVTKISDWKGPTIKVDCNDGSTYEADVVIFTPSLGVLKANYESLFEKKLPETKVNAINKIGFGAIGKVILHFPKRWWKDDEIWSFVWTSEDLDKVKEEFPRGVTKSGDVWLTNLVAFAPAANNPKVLIVWYAGSQIPEIEKLSDKDLIDGNMYMLKRFLGKHFNVTDPDQMIHNTWYSNPHFRGTYSYESVKGTAAGDEKLPLKLAEPLINKDSRPSLLFAGEATHPHYFATVHGAIESGYREAQRVIDEYNKL